MNNEREIIAFEKQRNVICDQQLAASMAPVMEKYTATVLPDDIKAQLVTYVSTLAKAGRPCVDLRNGKVNIIWSDSEIATSAWLFPDGMLELLLEQTVKQIKQSNFIDSLNPQRS